MRYYLDQIKVNVLRKCIYVKVKSFVDLKRYYWKIRIVIVGKLNNEEKVKERCKYIQEGQVDYIGYSSR